MQNYGRSWSENNAPRNDSQFDEGCWKDGSDPRESIREIERDPQYATDPELSDYSNDE